MLWALNCFPFERRKKKERPITMTANRIMNLAFGNNKKNIQQKRKKRDIQTTNRTTKRRGRKRNKIYIGKHVIFRSISGFLLLVCHLNGSIYLFILLNFGKRFLKIEPFAKHNKNPKYTVVNIEATTTIKTTATA